MTQALSPVALRNTLPAADLQTDTTARLFANRLEDGQDWRRRALPDRLAPTDEQRALLSRRVAVIDRWLAPSRRAAIIRAIGLVRGAMAIPGGAGDDVIDVYAEVLKAYPEPVIEDVCGRFLNGRLGNRVYAPTPAEIAHECRIAVADALAERGRIMLVLDAEIYHAPSDDDRERVRAAMDRFASEVGAVARGDARSGAVEPTGTDASVKSAARAHLAALQAAQVLTEAEETSA